MFTGNKICLERPQMTDADIMQKWYFIMAIVVMPLI